MRKILIINVDPAKVTHGGNYLKELQVVDKIKVNDEYLLVFIKDVDDLLKKPDKNSSDENSLIKIQNFFRNLVGDVDELFCILHDSTFNDNNRVDLSYGEIFKSQKIRVLLQHHRTYGGFFNDVIPFLVSKIQLDKNKSNLNEKEIEVLQERLSKIPELIESFFLKNEDITLEDIVKAIIEFVISRTGNSYKENCINKFIQLLCANEWNKANELVAQIGLNEEENNLFEGLNGRTVNDAKENFNKLSLSLTNRFSKVSPKPLGDEQ